MHIAGGYAVQAIEDLALFGARYAQSVVLHFNGQRLRIAARGDLNNGGHHAVFHRVVDQVVENAGKKGAVAAYMGQLRCRIQADGAALPAHEQGTGAHHLRQQCVHVHIGQFQLHALAFRYRA